MSEQQYPVVELTFHVRYAETDAMGVVHHASYIVYLEESRSNYIRQQGSSYADMEREGFFLGVIELEVRYVRPARFDDRITIRTWITTLRSRGLTFAYEIVDTETGATLVTATSRHICMDRDGQAVRIPDHWRRWIVTDRTKSGET